MSGQSGLTQQVDVYAFAMCCIEVLVKGSIPWPYADDDAVRHFVLSASPVSGIGLKLIGLQRRTCVQKFLLFSSSGRPISRRSSNAAGIVFLHHDHHLILSSMTSSSCATTSASMLKNRHCLHTYRCPRTRIVLLQACCRYHCRLCHVSPNR